MDLAKPGLVIRHRCNALADLAATDPAMGLEIDIRSRGDDLVLAHDPFADGPRLADWLAAYRHAFVILNVKEEGLEPFITPLLARQGIDRFFYLDQTFPTLIKTVAAGERRVAVRLSEVESVDTVLALSDRADWVWCDTFTRHPFTAKVAARLRRTTLKLCVVSPELLGRWDRAEVHAIRRDMAGLGLRLAAVCTKCPEWWTND